MENHMLQLQWCNFAALLIVSDKKVLLHACVVSSTSFLQLKLSCFAMSIADR